MITKRDFILRGSCFYEKYKYSKDEKYKYYKDEKYKYYKDEKYKYYKDEKYKYYKDEKYKYYKDCACMVAPDDSEYKLPPF